jgi:hypothetical protein
MEDVELKFDHKKESIEAIGLDKDKTAEFVKGIAVFMVAQGKGKPSELLEEFIKSEDFKNIGIKLETKQDYFALGVMFMSAIGFIRREL